MTRPDLAELHALVQKWRDRAKEKIATGSIDMFALADGMRDCASDLAALLRKIEQDSTATEPEMCPNCVTPWKCNGPHIGASPPHGYEDNAATGAQGEAVFYVEPLAIEAARNGGGVETIAYSEPENEASVPLFTAPAPSGVTAEHWLRGALDLINDDQFVDSHGKWDDFVAEYEKKVAALAAEQKEKGK